MPLSVSGVDSYDPDQGAPLYNHIERYEWELDGVAPYDYDDSPDIVATWTWNAAGTYNISLRVTDRFGETDTAWTTVDIEQGVPTELFLRGRHVSYSDEVTLQGRLKTATGDPLEGMSVGYFVDVNGDGNFHPDDEFVGTAVTDVDGWAYLAYDAWLAPGNYQVRAVFEGNDPYFASLNTESLMCHQRNDRLDLHGRC